MKTTRATAVKLEWSANERRQNEKKKNKARETNTYSFRFIFSLGASRSSFLSSSSFQHYMFYFLICVLVWLQFVLTFKASAETAVVCLSTHRLFFFRFHFIFVSLFCVLLFAASSGNLLHNLRTIESSACGTWHINAANKRPKMSTDKRWSVQNKFILYRIEWCLHLLYSPFILNWPFFFFHFVFNWEQKWATKKTNTKWNY